MKFFMYLYKLKNEVLKSFLLIFILQIILQLLVSWSRSVFSLTLKNYKDIERVKHIIL